MEQLTSLYRDVFQNILEHSNYLIIQNLCRIDRAAIELCNTKYRHIVTKKRREYFDERIRKKITMLIKENPADYSNLGCSKMLEEIFMKFVCEKDETTILDYMIKEKEMNPSFYNEIVIKKAIELRKIDLVRRLLQDPRVSVGGKYNINLTRTVRGGDNEMFDLLMGDPRLKLNEPNDETIKEAIRWNNYYALDKILERSDLVLTNKQTRRATFLAYSKINREKMLARLLVDPRIYNTLEEKAMKVFENYIGS